MLKSPCNVLKGISRVMANTVMLCCAGHVEAVRAPLCVQLHCRLANVQISCAKHFVLACADVMRYALWTGMCGSRVLCKLSCGVQTTMALMCRSMCVGTWHG